VLEADEKTKEADALFEDPKAQVASYGPCWAVRGRLARARGDEANAALSFTEAMAHDPLSVESACEAMPTDASPPATGKPGAGTALCAAAKARNEPDLGRD
jgi:hypothetical protein